MQDCLNRMTTVINSLILHKCIFYVVENTAKQLFNLISNFPRNIISLSSRRTSGFTFIPRIQNTDSFMKPEERPYLFHEALCLKYFCIAELNMIW